MGNLRSILNEHAERLGIKKQVEAVGVVEKATAEIAKYIPREDFEVVSFNRGTLKVGVISNSASSEILLQTDKIKRALGGEVKKVSLVSLDSYMSGTSSS